MVATRYCVARAREVSCFTWLIFFFPNFTCFYFVKKKKWIFFFFHFLKKEKKRKPKQSSQQLSLLIKQYSHFIYFDWLDEVQKTSGSEARFQPGVRGVPGTAQNSTTLPWTLAEAYTQNHSRTSLTHKHADTQYTHLSNNKPTTLQVQDFASRCRSFAMSGNEGESVATKD